MKCLPRQQNIKLSRSSQ